ncbi:MAG: hypothetical protein NC048_00465 [Bacteroides sp.]|nr:hypothetical protein [Bacteroides sp.]MCM1085246.1 hypothetical protein [Bacteroides sp.]MCM1553957.1 hypothetical protein [Bacteroides sp.]
MTRFATNPDYKIKHGYVLSNNRLVETEGKITYIPVYYAMFLNTSPEDEKEILI